MAKCDGGGGAGTGATGGAVDTPGAGAVLEGKGNWGLKDTGGDSYVCVDSGDSSAIFTWAGQCAGGVPTGKGVMGWDDGNSTGAGSFVNGKTNGRWVVRYANGDVQEGPIVNGKRNGRWVLRYANGNVQEGPYVDGKRNGRWVERFANGDVDEGPYVDGKENGRWVSRLADGDVYDVCFRAGSEVDCN